MAASAQVSIQEKAVLDRLKSWRVNDVMAMGVRSLFKNRETYMSEDPFSQLLQFLRRHEYSKKVPNRITYTTLSGELNLPDLGSSELVKQLVGFGDSNGIGMKHLAKILSVTSIKRVWSIVVAIREALGNLPPITKSRGMEATFMEVVASSSCLREDIAQPQSHALEMTVEALIKVDPTSSGSGSSGSSASFATFDECLMLFIRRVVEEAYQADQGQDVLTACIKVVMGGGGASGRRTQKIDIKSMKTRRQQVLSILKAAIVDDGEISLQMFMRVKRILPPLNRELVMFAEPSVGYIRINRRFHFSYMDQRGLVRCFCKTPLESLARGIFFDKSSAKLYKNVYLGHLKRMKRPGERFGGEENGGEEVDGGHPTPPRKPEAEDDPLLIGMFSLMAFEAKSNLVAGEYVVGAEWLLHLQSLLSFGATNITPCISQLIALLSSDVAHFRCVRDAVATLRDVCALVATNITDLMQEAIDTNVEEVGVGSEEYEKKAAKLASFCESLAPAIVEVKNMLLGLLRVVKYSELQCLSAGIQSELWAMFQRGNKVDPVIDAAPLANGTQGSLNTLKWLKKIDANLQRIGCVLLAVETTIGAEIMTNLLHSDSVSVYLDLNGATEENFRKRFNEVPRTLCELLGFAQFILTPVQGGVLYSLGWIPLTLKNAATSASSSKTLNASQTPSTSETWDLNVLLGLNPAGKTRGIDFDIAVTDEANRYDVPKFMAPEGAKMRYLAETHALRALQEGLFAAALSSEARFPPYACISDALSRGSAFLRLNGKTTDSSLSCFMFSPMRSAGLISSLSSKIDPCKVNISGRKNLSGCIVAPNRVLSGLGRRIHNIFRTAWIIPPFLPHPPINPPGMNISCFCGVALETALRWVKPTLPLTHKTGQIIAPIAPSLPAPPSIQDFVDTSEDLLDYAGTIELEVVIRITYEHIGLEDAVSKTFAAEVNRCCQHMNLLPEWHLTTVAVTDSTSSASYADPSVDPRQANDIEYSGQQVCSDQFANMKMQAAVAKSGTAVLKCGLELAEHKDRPSLDSLILLFEDILSSLEPTNSKGGKRGGQGGGSGENEDYFETSGVPKSEGDGDATANDTDRICNTGIASRKIQALLRKATTTKCLVPCILRFTLLANIPHQLRNANADKTLSRLAFGSDENFSRLLACTVWLSPAAGKSVWGCLSATVSSSYCLIKESERRWQASQHLRKKGLFAEAHQQAFISSLLAHKYDFAMACLRMSVSCACDVRSALECTSLLLTMFEHYEDATKMPALVLGQTLTRHVSLAIRRILSGPQSVHLRGGCELLLNTLARFEKSLQLGRISLQTTLLEPNMPIPPSYMVLNNAVTAPGLGEAELQKSLGIAPSLENAKSALAVMDGLLRCLLEAFGRDVDANYPFLNVPFSGNKLSAEEFAKLAFGVDLDDLDNISFWLTREGLAQDALLESTASLMGVFPSTHAMRSAEEEAKALLPKGRNFRSAIKAISALGKMQSIAAEAVATPSLRPVTESLSLLSARAASLAMGSKPSSGKPPTAAPAPAPVAEAFPTPPSSYDRDLTTDEDRGSGGRIASLDDQEQDQNREGGQVESKAEEELLDEPAYPNFSSQGFPIGLSQQRLVAARSMLGLLRSQAQGQARPDSSSSAPKGVYLNGFRNLGSKDDSF